MSFDINSALNVISDDRWSSMISSKQLNYLSGFFFNSENKETLIALSRYGPDQKYPNVLVDLM